MSLLKAAAQLLVLFVCAILLLGAVSLRARPLPGGGDTSTEHNGDVNCDGKVDLADAISIIQWQLLGGPAPCAVAQEAGIQDQLKALGDQVQTLQSTVASRLPSPADLVNISGSTTFPTGGGSKVLYQVPDDKWLILTSFAPFNADIGMVKGDRSVLLQGWQTAGITGSPWKTWPSGIGLPPGSQLVISAQVSGPYTYTLTGYLLSGN